MKKVLIALVVLMASVCFGQNVRYSAPFPSISNVFPYYLTANVPPNSPVLAVCHSPANALPCTNYATTYTSLGVACPNGAQDTPDPNPSACQSTGDSVGNIAFWIPAGTYDYTVCISNNCFGPYTITIGISDGGAAAFASVSTKSLNGIIFADQWCAGSSDIGVCIANAIATLPPGGGVVYATNLTGNAVATLTIAKPVILYLPSAAMTFGGSPGIVVTSSATGTYINGLGEGATTISCSANNTNCVTWQAARGAMTNLTITTTQNATYGLVLDAPGAGQDVKFNYFWNLSITAPSTNTVDGVEMIASDASHKISFNHLENLEIIDYGNAGIHMATSGSVGPTDNVIIGGQFRQTAQRGTGILMDADTEDNSMVGGDISFYTTGIALAASSSVTDNKFFGTVPESNTNAVTVGSGATDNQFYGVPFGAQTFTDSGARTVVQSGNNALGSAGAAAQKQGAPFQALTFVSSNGFPQTFSGAGTAQRTITTADGNTSTVMVASLTTTGASSDIVTVAGMTSSGHCALQPTNTTAATMVLTSPGVYVSTKAAGQITVTHPVTASANFDVLCTAN